MVTLALTTGDPVALSVSLTVNVFAPDCGGSGSDVSVIRSPLLSALTAPTLAGFFEHPAVIAAKIKIISRDIFSITHSLPRRVSRNAQH
jgi:hypothetical protein